MSASKIARAINNLENNLQFLEEAGLAESEHYSNAQQAIEQLKSELEPRLLELRALTKDRRDRLAAVSGDIRQNILANWEQPAIIEFYSNMLTSLVNWEFPALEIFPSTGSVLPSIVSSEPVYIVDWCDEVLETAKSKFVDYYANKRLMDYKIQGYDLSALPQDSFGLVYCINWIRFEDLSGLSKLAENVFKVLMPGGIYIFNYNAQETYMGIERIENVLADGAKTDQLAERLTAIGFEILENRVDPNCDLTYFKCKRPGEIEMIKGASMLARIIDPQ